MSEKHLCEICGEPMPEGEEVFKYHGYSCDCPKPPLEKVVSSSGGSVSCEAHRPDIGTCYECKFLNEHFMCINDDILNNSNSIIEFMNIEQAENFGCIKFEKSAVR